MSDPVQIVHETGAATWPQIVTAAVAGAAFVLSCLALGFQFVTWRRSGMHVRVELNYSFLAPTPGPPSALIAISAWNSGRGGGEIRGLYLEPIRIVTNNSLIGRLIGPRPAPIKRSQNYWPTEYIGAQKVPTPIGASSSLTWSVARDDVWKFCRGLGYAHIRAVLLLGSGKNVRSRPIEVSGEYQEALQRAAEPS